MAQGAYLPFTFLPSPIKSRPGGSVPPLWFPRYGALPVVMSLTFQDQCKLKVAWDAWERKITSPKARARPTQAPTGLPPFCLMRDLGNGSTGTFDTDQQ